MGIIYLLRLCTSLVLLLQGADHPITRPLLGTAAAAELLVRLLTSVWVC